MNEQKKNLIQILSIITGFALLLFFLSNYGNETVDLILSIFPKSYLKTLEGYSEPFMKYILYPFIIFMACIQLITLVLYNCNRLWHYLKK